MSWSFSQSGGVKQVKDALKATYTGNPLSPPESELRHKLENQLTEIQKLGDDWQVTVSASGSQTTDSSNNVVPGSGALNISITY